MSEHVRKIQQIIAAHVDAWCRKSAQDVANTYTKDACFIINHGEPMNGHQAIAEMVNGFCDEFPDVVLRLDHSFIAGHHAVYVWTFQGTQVGTGKYVEFQGWEEWELDENLKVTSSRGWFDAEDYERQLQD